MKIGQPSELPGAAGSALQKAAQAPPQAVEAQVAPAQAKASGVTVSALTQALEKSALSSADSDVDLQKVDAVRTAIANKTLVVDPEKIADKMLANAQEFLNRTQH